MLETLLEPHLLIKKTNIYINYLLLLNELTMNLTVTLTKHSLGKQLEIPCKYLFIILKLDGGYAWVRQFAITLQKLTNN